MGDSPETHRTLAGDNFRRSATFFGVDSPCLGHAGDWFLLVRQGRPR